MSRAERSWQPSNDLPGTVGGPSTLSMPDDWTLSTPWQRAQQESDDGGAINDAERIVSLSDGDDYHRVLWALKSRTLVAECDCQGYHYSDGWCAHVASLWWQWVRGQIVVAHLDTGREYPAPPAWLRLDDDPTAYDHLPPAQLDAYLACDLGSFGVREFARYTDRAAGTIGNLLTDARKKTEGRL
ncbi:unknown [Haloarcula marismortui ATCC 43049]|uniref:SWIM zinc finger family protein n=1 Tax=Haloarcula marismortui (strain ATCC 43049 / DSM 3752 / JCM 8966 / VKM B-1809) TaxID=272569 RepID=Q5V4C7_HALMA|nr:sigma-70 region 4 domain-containing protein [Haloarcula marismortui]AAV45625.1 unknown [Haloarcula marismortui ATCC 43049]QCP90408.1 SWIM zinc finger family protein [Haloarcula marismortui ATCC 43049]